MEIYGAPLRECVQGDLIIVADTTAVVTKNYFPERNKMLLRDNEGDYWTYVYDPDFDYTIVEEMPVPEENNSNAD